MKTVEGRLGIMRRIMPLLLVAVIAFAAGIAGSNGAFAHLLGAGRGVPSASAAPTASPTLDASAVPVGHDASPAAMRATDAAAPTATTANSTPTASPTAAPTSVPTPAAPLALGQKTRKGAPIPTDGWTNGRVLTLQVAAPVERGTATSLRGEVELRPVGQSFNGSSTGAAPVRGGLADIVAHNLASGHYHWRARLVSSAGAGPWSAYASDASAFGVRREAPDAPSVSSPTDPRPGQKYATSTISFTWSAPADPSGIVGYGYRLDQDPHGKAHDVVRTQGQQVALGGLPTGTYYFHVRAVDGAGNWGPSTTFPARVDVTPPQVERIAFSEFYFNPALEKLHLTYQTNKVAHIVVGVYDSAGTRVRHLVLPGLKPANVPLDVAWDGRDDKGNLVPAGSYSMYVRATDRLGNTPTSPPGWGGLNVSYRRIVVSLTQQRLWAYDGPTLFLTALVTTGNKDLPTPTGLFHIMWARSPFTFHSPWPKGSPLYYEPSPVQYALYFHDYGYYIHDAPWRGQFGPGSNAANGTPGSNVTGTHGCVNVPSTVMGQLYAWATPGTAVQINQ